MSDRIAITAMLLGWGITSTGGGCRAYIHQPNDEGPYCLITDEGGTRLPTWGETLVLGHYPDPEDNGDGRTWTAVFTRNCDGIGTDAYVIDCNGEAIHDPMVGAGIGYGLPTDPEATYDLPRPIAQFLSNLYVASRASGRAGAEG